LSPALLPLLIAAVHCTPPQFKDLVGRWESQRVSQGGLGHVMDFRSDGSFVQATAVTVNMHYTVSGDRLTISENANAKPSPKGAIRFHVDGSTLTQTASDGSSTKAERVGAAEKNAPALIGVWKYRHYTGGTAFERYMKDGNMLFRLPMSSASGCFLVDSKTHDVALTAPDGMTKTFHFELAGDELRLPGGQDGHGYQRSSFGPWYEIDHIDSPAPKSP